MTCSHTKGTLPDTYACVFPVIHRNASGHEFCIFHAIEHHYAMATGLMATAADSHQNRLAHGIESDPGWLDESIAAEFATADRLRKMLDDGKISRITGDYVDDPPNPVGPPSLTLVKDRP